MEGLLFFVLGLVLSKRLTSWTEKKKKRFGSFETLWEGKVPRPSVGINWRDGLERFLLCFNFRFRFESRPVIVYMPAISLPSQKDYLHPYSLEKKKKEKT